jgi:FKBP-type peptidyl-prolyl cis-trans isomerase 2
MVTLKAGDLVRIAFTGTLDSGSGIFESTDEKVAKAGGLYSEKMSYGPRLVIFGRGFMIPGLEEGIVQMQPGQEARIHVPAPRAFGARQPDLVRMMSDKEILRAGVQPRIGLILTVDGVQARIKSVSPGRVMLDFNHPLAGEDLTYHLQLIEAITEPSAKAKALGGEFHTSLFIEKEAKPKACIHLPALLESGHARSLAAMLQASVGETYDVKIDS